MLLQFQNCAPAPSSDIATNNSSGGEARIIDDFNKAEIQFVQPSIQVHDEATRALIGGLCSRQRNGALLQWSVASSSGEALFGGQASCQNGQFIVDLQSLSDLVCGVDHLLVVETDWGGSTFAHISKRCQPLASEDVLPPEGSPYGTVCSIEYQPASASGQNCSEVCFRDQKLVSNKALDASLCSSLAQKLAGP